MLLKALQCKVMETNGFFFCVYYYYIIFTHFQVFSSSLKFNNENFSTPLFKTHILFPVELNLRGQFQINALPKIKKSPL